MQVITSADNQYLKLGRKLKQRKYRERENKFLLEGRVPVAEALRRHPAAVEVILVTAAQADWLARQPQTGYAAGQIDEQAMAQLCDTETPQGVAAIVRRPVHEPKQLARDAGLLLYLEGLSDPGNLGSIIRSALAFAVDAVLLGPGCVDAYSPKVVRASMGGILSLPLLPNVDLEQLLDLKRQGWRLTGSSPGAATDYYVNAFSGKDIVIMGSEATGMSAGIQGICDSVIRIPINSAIESLNVAAACAIILAEAYRQRSL